MRLNALLPMALFLVAVGAATADARPYDGSMWTNVEQYSVVSTPGKASKRVRSVSRSGERRSSGSYSTTGSYSGGVGPRPGKWCGWWMRTQKGGGPQYNVAWNWRNYGSPTGPQIGAVVVWRHHVGIITGRAANGQWIVKSGNDGGRVRERARSVSGAIFRI